MPARTRTLTRIRWEVMLGGNQRKIGGESYSLKPEQIAAIVRDVCVAANGPRGKEDNDDIVSMDEFCYVRPHPNPIARAPNPNPFCS